MKDVVNAYLPWLLSALTIAAMVMTGRRMRSGWGIALASQVLWLVWIATSGSIGLVPLTVALLGVYAYNFWGPIKVEGWVIVKHPGAQYRAWDSWGPKWVDHPDAAICCARREDAEQLAEGDDDAWRIVKVKVTA